MSDKASGVVDFGYLEGFVAGDPQVVDEILTLFQQEARNWAAGLAPSGDWRDVVHTLKGAARGIGAVVLGDLCARAEVEGEAVLPAVSAALEAALGEITAYQARRA